MILRRAWPRIDPIALVHGCHVAPKRFAGAGGQVVDVTDEPGAESGTSQDSVGSYVVRQHPYREMSLIVKDEDPR